MHVFLSWGTDHIGRQVGLASLANDEEAVRRISQAIDQGNRIWESWVNASLGEMVSRNGDEGRAKVPADKLGELPEIRRQYGQAVDSTVSVGVGTEMSHADQALVAAKLDGGDRIIFYTPDVGDQVEEAKKKGEQTESSKILDEYLGKSRREKLEAGKAPRGYVIHDGSFHPSYKDYAHDNVVLRHFKGLTSADRNQDDAGSLKWSDGLTKRLADAGWVGVGHAATAGDDRQNLSGLHSILSDPKHPVQAAVRKLVAPHWKKPAFELATEQGVGNYSTKHFVNGGNLVPFDPVRHDPTYKSELSKATAAHEPVAPSRVPTQPDQSEMTSSLQAQDEEHPPAPEQTHAAQDLEEELHGHAKAQEDEDAQKAQQSVSNLENAKQQLVGALQQIKQVGPILEQVRQSSPETYAAVLHLTSAVVGLAREVQAQQGSAMQKDERDLRVSSSKAPKRADDQDIFRYVSAIHTGSRADLNKVPMDTQFRLMDVPLQHLPALRQPTESAVQAYAARKTKFPPIVIGRGGSIPDGHHRIAAARLRGDQSIRAYVPVEEMERYGMVQVPKKMKKSEFGANDSYPMRADDVDILSYFMTVHTGSRADFKLVPYDVDYELRELPVSSLKTSIPDSNAIALGYSTRPTPFPPIIMKTEKNSNPLDGNHRVAAARLRGDEFIRAYVPMEKNEKKLHPIDRMVGAVQNALSDELRDPSSAGAKHCLAGHCYNASEALYHLLGGKEAGLTAMHVQHEGGPHWYLRNANSGRVIDATAGQFTTPVPYHEGKAKNFLTKEPSRKASTIISRVLGGTKKAELEPKGEKRNDLDGCTYCTGSPPKNREQAKRLKDTRQNRNRENALYRQLGNQKAELEGDMEKAKLPMPNPTPKQFVAPPGTVIDQKEKVQHVDGTTSWKQMKAGMIRSQDPAGHPTSSRTPNSK